LYSAGEVFDFAASFSEMSSAEPCAATVSGASRSPMASASRSDARE
jgi:hypothetical protein